MVVAAIISHHGFNPLSPFQPLDVATPARSLSEHPLFKEHLKFIKIGNTVDYPALFWFVEGKLPVEGVIFKLVEVVVADKGGADFLLPDKFMAGDRPIALIYHVPLGGNLKCQAVYLFFREWPMALCQVKPLLERPVNKEPDDLVGKKSCLLW